MFNISTTPSDVITNPIQLIREIESKYSQIELMEYFLQCEVSDKLISLDAYREDESPSCGFTLVGNRLFFSDYGTYIYGDWKVAASLYYQYISIDDSSTNIPQKDYTELIRRCYDDLVLSSNIIEIPRDILNSKIKCLDNKSKSDTLIEVSVRSYNNKDLQYWYPISKELLIDEGVYAINKVWINKAIMPKLSNTDNNPTYGYRYANINVSKWKIYKPLDSQYKWRNNTLRNRIDKSPNKDYNNDTPKILFTSKKDRLVFRQMLLKYNLDDEYYTYNYQSESYIPDNLLGNTRYMLRDMDYPGLQYSRQLKELFNINILELPDCKDVYEYVKVYSIDELYKLWKKWMSKI